MVLGEINEETKELNTKFIPLNEPEFEEVEFDITGILSKEELIEKLNEENFSENNYLKVVLKGKRKFEIEENEILKHLLFPNVIKLSDRTELEFDLDKISMQNNLKGIFVKTLLEKKKNEPEKAKEIDRAIEIGLRVILRR